MAKRPLIFMTAPYSSDHAPSVAIVNDGRAPKDVYPIAVGWWHSQGQVVSVPIPPDAPVGTYQCLEVQVDSIGHPLWPDELNQKYICSGSNQAYCPHCHQFTNMCECW